MNVMNETIQVLNIEIQNVRTSQAMKKAAAFFTTDSLNTIEFISMDTLVQTEDNQELQDAIEGIDLVVPGEAEILKAAEVEDETKLNDVEEGTLWQMLAKSMEKHRRRVYLVTDSEELRKQGEEYIQKRFRGIKLAGTAVLTDEESAEELIVNNINGAGVACVIGVMASPHRELFIHNNQALINAKVWVGIDEKMIRKEVIHKGFLQSFATKLLFRRKVVREKKEN